MRAHECHSCCFVCVRKMPQLRRSAPAGACRGQPGASPAFGPQAGFRGHWSDALKKHKFASCWRWNSYFSGERPRVLCRFLSIRKQGAFSIKRNLNIQRPFFLPHKQAARFPGKEKPEHSAPAKGENTAGRMPCAQTKAPSPCVGEGAFYAAAFTPLPNRTAGYIPLWRCFFPAYSRLSGQGARPRSPRCGIRRWRCGAKAPCAAPRGKTGCTGSWR